jgi:osmoprotectant transport system ATP-binding protein
MIELVALSKHYGGRPVVDHLDLRVESGELLVLCGGSGSGKTTTLEMVNRLTPPSAGCVRIRGRDTRELPGHELRRRIGYCFQQVGLFPHLTVAENVGVTPELLGWDTARIRARVDALLEQVELEPAVFRTRRPGELSGGQAQRVGLARALAAEPEVMLLDEPFGALDPPTRDRLQQAFQRIQREQRLTVLFVTHDMAEALLLADRIAVLEQGRLVQVGPPVELLKRPAHPRVAELLATPRRQAEALDRLLAASGV